MWLVI